MSARDHLSGSGAPEPQPQAVGPEPAEGADADAGIHGGRLEHPAPPAEPPPIRVSDRCAAIGMTGSGKSTILAAMWAVDRGQRLLIDVNDAYELGPDALRDPGGVCYAERLRDVDFRARTIHFVPRAQAERQFDDLYAAIYDRGHLTVWLDESYGPTTANRAPRWLRTVITQGRKRKIRHLAATQEPMNVLPVIYSQAEHVFLFRLTGRPDELGRLSPRFGLSVQELGDELQRLPDFGYLRASTSAPGAVYRMPPLPAELLERTRRHVLFPE